MNTRRALSQLGALVAASGMMSGCTVRYSQTLVDTIQRVSVRPSQNSDSGVQVGLALPLAGRLAVISFSEPMAADELLMLPCEVAFTQVDYRSIYYAYYIAVDIPEVTTTTYCIPAEPEDTRSPSSP